MAQDSQARSLSRDQQEELLVRLRRLLVDKYVFPEKAGIGTREISDHMERGLYSANPAEFAEAVTTDLQSATGDHHVRMVYDPERVSRLRHPAAHGTRPDPAVIAARTNHGFERVERLKGNVGYVDIRHFFSPEISGDTAAAAMRLISDADAVIIDLRNNTGGNPGMVQFLSSFFVGGSRSVHLNSIVSRLPQQTTAYWTLPHVPGPRMLNVDLAILTSSHTFSGGEEFAYNMKHLKRATVIGEVTAGGANPAGIDVISDDFYVTIPHAAPVNPLTQGNWEGTGVIPHVRVAASSALEVAHTRALEGIGKRTNREAARTRMEWLLEEVHSSYAPLSLRDSVLTRYVGQYGDCEILLEQDTLIFCRRFFRYRLTALSETVFWLDGPAAGFESRLEFEHDESGRVTALTGKFPDGRSIRRTRLCAAQEQPRGATTEGT